MAKTNDKDNFEKHIELACKEYGKSEKVLLDKSDGTVTDLPNGFSVGTPPTHLRNKKGEIIIKFQPKEVFVKLYKKGRKYLRENYSYKEQAMFTDLADYARM